MRRAYLFAIVAALSCSRSTPRSDPPPSIATDSVVLQRTRCYGTCPAYRLRVGRSGEVVFTSQYPVAERHVDTVQAWVADSIGTAAARLGLFDLPDDIRAGSQPLCQTVATDLPTITIGVFGARTKQVVYYTGCVPPKDHPMARSLPGLRELANRIDQLTHHGPDDVPTSLLGEFVDDYGARYRVTAKEWVHLPRARYHVTQWHVAEHYLIAQNDSGNSDAPGRWSRIDWIALPDMAPYTWGYCYSAYDAPSATAAQAADSVVRRATPKTGCNGFPFSRMRRATP